MRIENIRITNYRSIKDLEITMNHGCQVLVGINESGKSNILKALSLLDPTNNTSIADLRIERRDENPIEEGRIQFHFQLDRKAIEQIVEKVSRKFDELSLTTPLVTHKDKQLFLADFCKERAIGFHEIRLPGGERSTKYWTLPKGTYQITPGWQKHKTSATQPVGAGKTITTSTTETYFHASSPTSPIDGEASDSLLEDINKLVGLEVVDHIKSNLPTCIYWKYSDQYLLPSSINIDAFSQNPEICIPLRSMFELAGYSATNISTAIQSTRLQQPNRYINLLNKVSEAATRHLHSVWRDQKGVRVELRPNGSELVPIIQDDQVGMDMLNRSDGFKRLVTFLLQVSARVKTEQIANTLILIDEPEIALHPRGARNLMNELIEIGKNNQVVYSTHSIFMIDKDCIDRHIIVEKKSEITSISRAEKSRIQDEDVIYSAIGYSIFESVNETNIIFEGWKDKELFRVLRDAVIKKDRSKKEKLESIGLTFAEGVKDVKNVCKFLELANRPCLIISDNDAAGMSHKKEHERTRTWGTWLTIGDILTDLNVFSSEDLLCLDAIIKRANQFQKEIPNLGEVSKDNFTQGTPNIKCLETWLKSANLEQEEHKLALLNLKNKLFDKLKRDEILESADKLIEFVLNHQFKQPEL